MKICDIEELKGKSGIYCWTSPSGKQYVGQAVDLADRHRKFLTHGVYSGTVGKYPKIERARRKYPDFSKWKYELLEYCDIDQLNEREEYWIAELDTYVHGYNSTPGGNARGETSPETRARQREAKMIFFANGGQVWCKGQHLSEEHRKKNSEAHLKDKYQVYGYSLETGELLYEYSSPAEAANALNVYMTNIKKVCNGERLHAWGVVWKKEKYTPEEVLFMIDIWKQESHKRKSKAITKRLLENHPNSKQVVEVKPEGTIIKWENCKRASEHYETPIQLSRTLKNGDRLRRFNNSTWYYQWEVDSGIEPIYLKRKSTVLSRRATKGVIAIFPNGEEVYFESIKKAETALGIGRGGVSKVLSPVNLNKTAGGQINGEKVRFTFRYAS